MACGMHAQPRIRRGREGRSLSDVGFGQGLPLKVGPIGPERAAAQASVRAAMP